jgi:hypothetical protein
MDAWWKRVEFDLREVFVLYTRKAGPAVAVR